MRCSYRVWLWSIMALLEATFDDFVVVEIVVVNVVVVALLVDTDHNVFSCGQ